MFLIFSWLDLSFRKHLDFPKPFSFIVNTVGNKKGNFSGVTCLSLVIN